MLPFSGQLSCHSILVCISRSHFSYLQVSYQVAGCPSYAAIRNLLLHQLDLCLGRLHQRAPGFKMIFPSQLTKLIIQITRATPKTSKHHLLYDEEVGWVSTYPLHVSSEECPSKAAVLSCLPVPLTQICWANAAVLAIWMDHFPITGITSNSSLL